MKSYRVLLGLGSNHNARLMLVNGLNALAAEVDIVSLSRLYQNPAQGAFSVNAPDYTNGVVVFDSILEIKACMRLIKQIETRIGGVRSQGLCPLDLDIIAIEGFQGKLGNTDIPRALSTSDRYILQAIEHLINSEAVLDEDSISVNWPEIHVWQQGHEKVKAFALEFYHSAIAPKKL